VFFKLAQAALKGVLVPKEFMPKPKPKR